MSEQSLLGVDYQNQPNFDAWWTPGWSSQNQSYLPVPANVFQTQGFASTAAYVTVLGNYFDSDGNPLSGYLTFWPSSPLTFSVGGVTTVIPQRRVGTNFTMLGINQFGDGKIYLWNGQLVVNLLATNCANMSPSSFTYHVKEHFLGGREYDIRIPASLNNPDINSLIVGEAMDVDDFTPIIQSFASQTAWAMFYTFPYLPTVITTDTNGNQIFGQVTYSGGQIPGFGGTVTVTFGSPTSGTMELK